MTSVALVNASGPTDSISIATETLAQALLELGATVHWYQCLDAGLAWDRPLPVPWTLVRGVGSPSGVVGMGLNRLWAFPRHLPPLTEELVVLSDPTLGRLVRKHPRVVVQVHDLRPLGRYSDRLLTRLAFRRAVPLLRRASRVLVPSDSVRMELSRLGITSETVRVVPEVSLLPPDPGHVLRSVERIRADGVLRVLSVGTDRPYKNLPLLVRLAQRMAQQPGVASRVEFTLVSRLRPSTRSWIDSLSLDNLRLRAGLPSLAEEYDRADVLLQPSRYEGFGRPLVEAMGYGLPIVATDLPVFREVAGTAATYLSPEPLEPWVEAVTRLTDPTVLAAAAARSAAQSERYGRAAFRSRVAEAVLGTGP